jgi:hypothetical protein
MILLHSTIINDRLLPKKERFVCIPWKNTVFFSPMPYIMADSESEIASKGSSHHKGTDHLEKEHVAKKTQKRLARALQ